MRNKTPQHQEICQNCGLPMIFVDHYDFDGIEHTFDPYWECPDGCPTEVDTDTEYGIVTINNERGGYIL